MEERPSKKTNVYIIDDIDLINDGSRGSIMESFIIKLKLFDPKLLIIAFTNLDENSNLIKWLQCEYTK